LLLYPESSYALVTISFLGSLRRHFFIFASNAVSQRRCSAQALLTLALTLYSGCSVTFLLFFLVTNHSLLIIWFYCVKVVNSTRLCSGGLSWLLGDPNRTPPQKIHRFNFKEDSFYNITSPWVFLRKVCPPRLPLLFFSTFLLLNSLLTLLTDF
jgi:hypothetical protein